MSPAHRCRLSRLLLAAGGCWLVVAVLGVTTRSGDRPLAVDRAGRRVAAWRVWGVPVVPLRVASDYQQLGDARPFAIMVAATTVVAVVAGERAFAAVAAGGPAAAVVLNEKVVKPLVRRHIPPAPGLAFPSGHVAAIASVAVMLTLLAHRRWPARGTTGVALGVLALATLGAMASVVRTESHQVTDALGGVALAFGTVLTLGAGATALEEARRDL